MDKKIKDRQKVLNEFLEQIHRIERELDKLEHFSHELCELFYGAAFVEQSRLAVIMENLVMATTHEAATQIGFDRNAIENIVKFIEFREGCCEFSDNELNEILDNNLSMEMKRNLSKRFCNVKSMIERIDGLKQKWDSTFDNMEYSKIKKKLRI